MQHVTIALDTLKPETWTKHDVEDIRHLLMSTFPEWPASARIYHGSVSQVTDITPADEAGIELLGKLPGPFFVMLYPGEPITALYAIVGIFIAAAAYVLTAAVPPAAQPPPLTLGRNNQISSPNNELSDRSNRARINGRIPDIFGTVRSTPDLISAPYKIFENNREVEYAYMCIGRGSYEISSVKDGETAVENIPGTTVQVYGPYASPNSFDPNVPGVGDPELVIGELKRVPVLTTKRSNSVNGQVLRPPNDVSFVGVGNIRFRTPNLIELPNNSVDDFTNFFVEGDEIVITGAIMTAGTDVTQHISCQFTMIDVQQRYPRDGANHGYDTDGGSMIFEASYESVVNGLFIPGNTIILTTIADSPYVDFLNGTYNVLSVHKEGPNDPTETKYNVPTLIIVKLDDPAAVNANWNSMETTHNQLQFAYRFGSEVELDGSGSYDLDLDGTYVVVSVTAHQIVLDNPVAVNSDWAIVTTKVATPFLSPTLTATGEKWVGPFILDDFEMIEAYCNFVAANGIYKDDGVTQEAASVGVQVECTPVDLDDEPLADSELFNLTLKGSSTLKEKVASTLKAHFSSFYGRTSIRARRLTPADLDFEGTVVDEIRWLDAYSVAGVDQFEFGNITTVFSITFATASALAVKERKLNMLVQRKVPTYADGAFTNELAGTNDAALILAAICRDRYIGNRSLAEIDMTNFIAIADAIEEYFGTARCREFSYTFDKDNISFEETVATIAGIMFCVAYRRGNVIRLSFEKETEDSTILFNHRNKIPRTETRTISFGQSNDNDGVEYTYVDPIDDSINTVYLPEGYPAINPKKVESVGVRDHLLAYFHVWRVWNRIVYQNTIVEFEATNEADLLIINDRILVSDGTRIPVNEGEVVGVDALELELSQEVDLTIAPSYNMFLQLYDGSTQSIEITAGSASNKVVLAEAPLLPLVTDPDQFARTTYVIVGSTDKKQTAFLVTEKSPAALLTANLKGINYDTRYYGNDKDFINDIIGENGYGRTGGFTPATGSGYPDAPYPFGLVPGVIGGRYYGYIQATDTITESYDSTGLGIGSLPGISNVVGGYSVMYILYDHDTECFIVGAGNETDFPPTKFGAITAIEFTTDQGTFVSLTPGTSTETFPFDHHREWWWFAPDGASIPFTVGHLYPILIS